MCYAYNQPLNRPATLSSSFRREIPSVGEEEEEEEQPGVVVLCRERVVQYRGECGL